MRKILVKNYIYLLLIIAFIISGCSNSQDKEQSTKSAKRLHIVTTFYPMYYFTKQVVGNKADVDLLIPNGTEPHDWEPTTKDLANIQDSDIFVYNSRYFETWTKKMLTSVDTSNLKVVEASSGIKLINALEENKSELNSGSSKDPHVWLSPVLAQHEVEDITRAIIKADAKNKNLYEENASSLKSKLSDLDQLYKTTLKTATQKQFVTQHAAFGYLAREYGLKQIPIAGLSPDVEPSMGKLQELAELTKKNNIKIIYFEGLTSSKVAQTLADETGAKTEVLNPLEGLTKEDQKEGLDYIGVMKKNLNKLKLSLFY
ncbi:metal ABC transporter substrate-binding protein [Neobacillus terrae]|uniref:metal ABC transporter substrate-binding protein n=1 Tax=Neobacillus terrae TaxID=3034837 RepID=UPI00140B0FCE|nr:zinc ABC transporter substrate-binding protein [Neobacillus terrae]